MRPISGNGKVPLPIRATVDDRLDGQGSSLATFPPFAQSRLIHFSAMRFGDFQVDLASDREFRLDGGAMFGVVPKVLWQRSKPPDESNRIRMITHSLVITNGDSVVLVDAGLGDKLDERTMEINAIDPEAPHLLHSLEAVGYQPEDVDHVILTHLHFDHCGWSTSFDGERVVPTFGNATYWVAEGELAHARQPNRRDRVSYDRRNFDPLAEAGVLETFRGPVEPVPGVRMEPAPGHTGDMCAILVDGGEDGRLVFFSDLCPTAAHTPTAWVMGYDLYPVTTMENKERWLGQAEEEGWLCVFQHDPELPLGRLEATGRPGRWEVSPAAL